MLEKRENFEEKKKKRKSFPFPNYSRNLSLVWSDKCSQDEILKPTFKFHLQHFVFIVDGFAIWAEVIAGTVNTNFQT